MASAAGSAGAPPADRVAARAVLVRRRGTTRASGGAVPSSRASVRDGPTGTRAVDVSRAGATTPVGARRAARLAVVPRPLVGTGAPRASVRRVTRSSGRRGRAGRGAATTRRPRVVRPVGDPTPGSAVPTAAAAVDRTAVSAPRTAAAPSRATAEVSAGPSRARVAGTATGLRAGSVVAGTATGPSLVGRVRPVGAGTPADGMGAARAMGGTARTSGPDAAATSSARSRAVAARPATGPSVVTGRAARTVGTVTRAVGRPARTVVPPAVVRSVAPGRGAATDPGVGTVGRTEPVTRAVTAPRGARRAAANGRSAAVPTVTPTRAGRRGRRRTSASRGPRSRRTWSSATSTGPRGHRFGPSRRTTRTSSAATW